MIADPALIEVQKMRSEVLILIENQNKQLERLNDIIAGKDGLLVKQARIETKVNAIIGISAFAMGSAVTVFAAYLYLVIH